MEENLTIGYVRLSDSKQLDGGGGENQEDAIREYAKRYNLTLYKDKVFWEIYTGTEYERPTFDKLKEEIRKLKGRVKYFLIKQIDRSSRAGSPDYLKMKRELSSLGVELRDTGGVIQPIQNRLSHRGVGFEWSNSSPSHIAEILLAEMASEERKNILTRTVDTSVHRVETGYTTRKALYGYKNERILCDDGQYKYILIPDEEEARFIRIIFDESVKGILSDKEITNKINALGCRTRIHNIYSKSEKVGETKKKKIVGIKKANLITIKQMQKWRQNQLYCGVKVETWGKTQKRKIVSLSVGESIISIETFNRANKGKVFVELGQDKKIKILYGVTEERQIKRRQKFNKDYIFKNIILCPLCKKPLKGSPSTSKNGKRVPYYHCERSIHRGESIRVPKEKIEREMYAFIASIRFSDKHYEILKKFLELNFRLRIKQLNSTHIKVSEDILLRRKELADILDNIGSIKSNVVREDLEKKYEQKRGEISLMEEEKSKMLITEEELNTFFEIAKNIIEHPAEILTDVESFEQQVSLYSLFFEEFPTYDEIISGTPKLTLFFKLLDENNDEDDTLVTLGVQNWKSIIEDIRSFYSFGMDLQATKQ